jgi:hypothetical protein
VWLHTAGQQPIHPADLRLPLLHCLQHKHTQQAAAVIVLRCRGCGMRSSRMRRSSGGAVCWARCVLACRRGLCWTCRTVLHSFTAACCRRFAGVAGVVMMLCACACWGCAGGRACCCCRLCADCIDNQCLQCFKHLHEQELLIPQAPLHVCGRAAT